MPRRTMVGWVWLMLAAGVAPIHGGAAANNLMPNPGYESGLLPWSTTGGASYTTQTDIVRTGDRAARVSNRDSVDDGLGVNIKNLITPGRAYLISAWMRAEGPSDTRFGLTARVSDTPTTNFFALERRDDLPGETWTEVRGIYWHQPQDADADVFVYVEKPGAGRDIYVDDWSLTELPEWRAQSDAGIESNRRRDFTVEVRDANGRPLEGADVSVRQLRRRFGFGSAVSSVLLTNQTYRDMFFDTLGYEWATFQNETKWREMEPSRDNLQYGEVDQLVAMLRNAGVLLHAHTLFWGSKMSSEPGWVSALSPADLQQEVNERIDQTLARYDGDFVSWDVNNELINDNDYYEQTLGPGTLAEMFRRAQSVDPDLKLVLNETGPLVAGTNAARKVDDVAAIVDELEAASPPVALGGINVQGHFRFTSVDPYVVRDRLDQLAALGYELWISELDILEPDDDERAEQFETLYRVAFSHPAVVGVMTWGFWGADHWLGQDAVFVDDDWTVNAAGQRYIQLMQEWRTDLEDVTPADGLLGTRGYHGTYEVTASFDGVEVAQTFELEPGASPLAVIVDVPVVPPCGADIAVPEGSYDAADVLAAVDAVESGCAASVGTTIDFEAYNAGQSLAGQGSPSWQGNGSIASIGASNGVGGGQAITVNDNVPSPFADVRFEPDDAFAGGALDGTGFVSTTFSFRQTSAVKPEGRNFRQTLVFRVGRVGSSTIVRINVKEDGGLTIGTASSGEVQVVNDDGSDFELVTGEWVDVEVLIDFDSLTQTTIIDGVTQPTDGLAASFASLDSYGVFGLRYSNNADAHEAFDIDNLRIAVVDGPSSPLTLCAEIDRAGPIGVLDAFDVAATLNVGASCGP